MPTASSPQPPARAPRRAPLALALVLTMAAPGPAPAAPGDGRVAALFHQLAPGKQEHPTRVRVLTDNAAAWYARWWALESAQETIDVQYFSFGRDVLSKAFMGMLLKKAREGVEVRLMIDARGSKELARRWRSQAFLQELAELPNVSVKVFRPWHKNLLSLSWTLRSLVASNHDKLILVDGKRAVVGGRNMRRGYFLPAGLEDEDDGRGPGIRDRDVLLEGEGVGAAVRAAFLLEFETQRVGEIGGPWFGDWRDQSIELALAERVASRWLRGAGPTPPVGEHAALIARLNDEVAEFRNLTTYPEFAADPWQGSRMAPCKVLDKSTWAGEVNDITPSLLAAIDAAETRVVIQNAYVILSQEARAALVRAAARGVEVLVHTNGPTSTDAPVTQGPFLREWKEMLRDIPTLRLYMETGTRLIHAKTIIIDEVLVGIGSYNMDPMSQGLNSELLALFRSPELGADLTRQIEADAARATRCEIRIEPDGTLVGVVGPDQYLRGVQGAWIRLISRLRFLRPIL